MADAPVLAEVREGVGLLTLNRPHRLNALNGDLVEALDRTLTRWAEDPEVRAVVLTGAGDRAFSSGSDIHELVSLPPEDLRALLARLGDLLWRVADYPKPTLGALNGLAYGGGALLASCLDIRIGCERTRFRFLAVTYGRLNSTWTLPLVVGWPMAKELLFTGREVGAEEALRIGLLNRLVPAQALMDTALDLARQIARNDPRMVQGAKALLHRGVGLGYRERYDLERTALRTWLREAPPQEGFRPFLERQRSHQEGGNE